MSFKNFSERNRTHSCAEYVYVHSAWMGCLMWIINYFIKWQLHDTGKKWKIILRNYHEYGFRMAKTFQKEATV